MFPERDLTGQIIGAAIEVHRELGPGLLETTYQVCLEREFNLRQIPFVREKPVTVTYKGISIDCAYRLDFLVADRVIVELKAVDEILPIHEAQILTYIKLVGCEVGLLINFNTPVLKQGIKRFALSR